MHMYKYMCENMGKGGKQVGFRGKTISICKIHEIYTEQVVPVARGKRAYLC